MVSGYFRSGAGYFAKETGFSYRREAQETHISQNLQFQPDVLFFSRFSLFRIGRSSDSGSGKVGISSASMTALRYSDLLFVLGHICQKFTGAVIINHGSQRNIHIHVFPVLSEHFLSAAIGSGFGSKFAMAAEINQRVQTAVSTDNNRSSSAAITAAGSAAGYVLFPAEGNHAVSTGTGDNNYFCSINKHKHTSLKK